MKTKPVSGSQAFLDTLWKKFGGPAALKKKYFPDWNTGDFFNWRARGQVPVELTFLIAKKLNIPVWGLAYEKLSLMFPEKIPNWKEVIGSYEFSKAEMSFILSFKEPNKYGKGN